jgi:hypothetical protein
MTIIKVQESDHNNLLERVQKYELALIEILEVGHTNAFGGGIEYTGENHGECRKIAQKALIN